MPASDEARLDPPAFARVRVREATPTDHAAVAELSVAAYDALNQPVSDDYRAALADVADRARAQATVLVAEDAAGEVVGSVTLVLEAGDYFEHRFGVDGDAVFRMLAVRPSAWGKGVGGALVDECVRRASAAGRTRLVITTMPWMTTAQEMYERRGFVRRPELDLDFSSGKGLAYTLDLGPDRTGPGARSTRPVAR